MHATLKLLAVPVLCAGLATAQGLDAARLAKIPPRMRQFVDSATVSGAVTLVARHGAIAALNAVGY